MACSSTCIDRTDPCMCHPSQRSYSFSLSLPLICICVCECIILHFLPQGLIRRFSHVIEERIANPGGFDKKV